MEATLPVNFSHTYPLPGPSSTPLQSLVERIVSCVRSCFSTCSKRQVVVVVVSVSLALISALYARSRSGKKDKPPGRPTWFSSIKETKDWNGGFVQTSTPKNSRSPSPNFQTPKGYGTHPGTGSPNIDSEIRPVASSRRPPLPLSKASSVPSTAQPPPRVTSSTGVLPRDPTVRPASSQGKAPVGASHYSIKLPSPTISAFAGDPLARPSGKPPLLLAHNQLDWW
jgi:hypothetical protein